MKYLNFKEKHLPEIVEFWNKSFPENRITEEKFRKRVIEHREFNEKRFIICKEYDELIGFSHAADEGDENFVCFIYVDPKHRERGIGSELLKKCTKDLEGRVWVGKEFETPFYGNREGPFPPLYGRTEFLGLKSGDREAIRFFRNKGFRVKEKTVSLECSLKEYEYDEESEDYFFSTEKNVKPWNDFENDVFVSWCSDWRGESIGTVVWFPLEDERAGIYDFYVKRQHRIGEVGNELMNYVLRNMQKKSFLFCNATVNAFDPTFLFYEDLGFKPESYWVSMASERS